MVYMHTLMNIKMNISLKKNPVIPRTNMNQNDKWYPNIKIRNYLSMILKELPQK